MEFGHENAELFASQSLESMFISKCVRIQITTENPMKTTH